MYRYYSLFKFFTHVIVFTLIKVLKTINTGEHDVKPVLILVIQNGYFGRDSLYKTFIKC